VKAVLLDGFGGAEKLIPGEIDEPVPAPDQILIDVRAAAVNRPDIVQREGRYPPPPGESPILGLECAGTVAALGRAVRRHRVGDRVFALLGGGGYAERAVVHEAHALPIPERLDFAQAACIAETYITAYQNLFENGHLADGESVLLHGGGGGVTTAAIQLVKALLPASPILVTASPGKIDRVRQQGVTHAIDYRSQDFSAQVAQLTERRGVDVILDHIGAAYLEKNLNALAIGGRLLVIGIMQGSDASISLGRLMVKRQRIIGSVLRPRPAAEKAAIIARFAGRVMPLFAQGRIAPVIDRVFPLAEAAAAHRRMEAGEHFGKIVLSVGE
jgi:putative PIG3 family NAD(P)H quinone oxidoreductase